MRMKLDQKSGKLISEEGALKVFHDGDMLAAVRKKKGGKKSKILINSKFVRIKDKIAQQPS